LHLSWLRLLTNTMAYDYRKLEYITFTANLYAIKAADLQRLFYY